MHAHEKRIIEFRKTAPKKHRPDYTACPHWDYEDESPECDCPCSVRCNADTCRPPRVGR